MTTARQYADAVMRRSRVPMEPVDVAPDWRDRPREAKFFPGAELVPLPAGDYPADASVQAGLTAPGPATAGAALRTDVTGDTGALASLHVFVNQVAGIAPGSYRHDPAAGELRLVRAGRPGGFLQRNHFQADDNLEQAGAVLVPAVRIEAVLDAAGDRGYRLVTALVGASCQAVYTACAALGLACGAALGFDAVSYVEELGLAGTGEIPLLLMMVGPEGSTPAGFRYEIA